MWARSVVAGAALFALGGHGAFAQSNGELGYQQMQQAMTGTVDSWAQSQGYSLSDPRVYNTLVAMGAAVAATVVTTNVGSGLLLAGSAPAWGTVLGVAAIAAGAGALYLGGDKLYQWAFSGTKAAPAIAVTAPGGSTAVNIVIQPSGTSNTIASIIAASIGQAYTIVSTVSANSYTSTTYFSTTAFTNPNGSLYIAHQGPNTYSGTSYYTWNTAATTSSTPCPTGTTQSGTTCVGSSSGTTTTSGQTLIQAVTALPASELTQPLYDQTMAQLANYLLAQSAAGTGYNGIPYTAATPVTAANVDTAQATAGTNWPTVAAITTAVPSGGFVPATSATGADTPVSASSVVVNSASPCVADPNVAGCADLGSAPASSSVAASAVAVTLSPWNVGPSSGTCPADLSVLVLGESLAFSYGPLCRLATGVQPVVLALCGLAAALIVVAGIRS